MYGKIQLNKTMIMQCIPAFVEFIYTTNTFDLYNTYQLIKNKHNTQGTYKITEQCEQSSPGTWLT